MAISVGSRLGPYEITAPLGAGGMGEVYRARDTRLDRDVAIKVLPDSFAEDNERVRRFQREAKVLASLNHPHIAAIYDVETDDRSKAESILFLVLEYVEGESLADRLKSGPLSVEDSLSVVRQVAEALEAAHEKSVIHRDLKPGNVQLRADGTVKVLDFGLAKALEEPRTKESMAGSPTESVGVTQEGTLLGTAAYMAPEQARGRSVDKRADIWAFGCVLYEMLTGQTVFGKEDLSSTVAAILEREPEWQVLPEDTPARIRGLLHRCLQKDPDWRLRDIGDAWIEIDETLSQPTETVGEATPPHPARWKQMLPWGLATLMTALAAIALWSLPRSEPPPWADGVVHFTFGPPEDTIFDSSLSQPFELSPDGSTLAFVALNAAATPQLWVRELHSDRARRLQGTDGAWAPFWSPDSEWIGFYAPGALKRVRAAGGEPATITTIRGRAWSTAAWGPDGTILFKSARIEAPLERISFLGGAASLATSLEPGQEGHRFPAFLEDGGRFIYRGGGIYVSELNGVTERILHDEPIQGRIAYSPGYLFHIRDEALVVSEFDERRGSLSGEAPRLVDGIPTSGPWRTPYSVSRNGVLAFQRNAAGYETVLTWFDRDGKRLGNAVSAPRRYRGFSVSPDGGRIAYSLFADNGSADIWVRDLARGSEDPWTSHGDALGPVWSSDGAMLAFEGSVDIFVVSESGDPTRLTKALDAETVVNYFPLGWRPGDDAILYGVANRDSSSDLGVLWLDRSRTEPLPINTEFIDCDGSLSRDGKWIAYTTDRSGMSEVWVARFPSVESPERISVSGGRFPQWRADGKELFFVSGENELMVAPMDTAGSPVLTAPPTMLFRLENNVGLLSHGMNPYSVTPDGDRFLIPLLAEVAQPPIHVILNWRALLEK